jgi:hypothetical protein
VGKVVLVRPDGSTLNVDASDAPALRTLGYKDQTPEQSMGEAIAESTREHYTTPGQKVKTALEGGLSGLSLGLSDAGFDALGWDTAERAGYNPGIRLGSEIVGGLAPLAMGGGLARLTPAGLLSEGALAAGKAAGGSVARRMAVAGAVEGAGLGAGAAITNSVLNSDPLTVEAIAAGVGWGGLFGGGFGGIVGTAVGRVEARAAAKAASEAREEAMAAGWSAFKTSVDDITQNVDKIAKSVGETVDASKASTALASKEFEAAKASIHSQAQEAVSQAEGVRNTLFNDLGIQGLDRPDSVSGVKFLANKKEGIRALKEMKEGLKARDYAKIERASERFNQHIANINADLTAVAEPRFPGEQAARLFPNAKAVEPPRQFQAEVLQAVLPHEQMKLSAAEQGFQELKRLSATRAALSKFPVNVSEFAGMTPGRAEKLFGAVDNFLKTGSGELQGMRDGLKDAIVKLQDSLGIRIDGPPATQLRGVYEAVKGIPKNSTEGAVEKARGLFNDGMGGAVKRGLSYAAGRKASKVALNSGFGGPVQTLAYEGARNTVMGLLSLKSAVVGGISKVAMDWVPKTIAKGAKVAPRIEPLVVRLDGSRDQDKRTRKELMKARANEIREAAGGVRDVLYKNVSGVAVEHPEFAAALHAHAVKRYQFILDKLPKDPGQAFSRMKSLWSPDNVQTEKFARYYRVFQDPVGVVREVLSTGRVLPEYAEALREMDPALFTQLRVSMLERLSDPKVLDKLSYNEQVGLGTLLSLPIHSTMTPQFIAQQQQMYAQRNEPLPMPAQPGVEGGGRPAGDNPRSTSSQRITEH